MKKVIDFLRKIWILKVSSGDYINGEFDDRKDLKEKKLKVDIKKWTINTSKKLPIFFWIIVSIISILILFTVILLWFSFWFFVIFIFWIWFLLSIKNSIILWIFVFKSSIILFLVSFVFTFFIVIFSIDTETDNSNSLTEITNYNIVWGNKDLSWSIELKKTTYKNWNINFYAAYNFVINTDLPNNDPCLWNNWDCQDIYSYVYINSLNSSNIWALSAIYENNITRVPTNKFNANFYYSFDSYQDFLSANRFNIHDWAKFQHEEDIVVSEWLRTSNWVVNQEEVVKKWEVVRTYEFSIEEVE